MKFTRILALIAGTALLITACNQDSDELVAVVKENTNPLLAHVPADTAYVFAALVPIPEEITDAYVSRFQPVLDVLANKVGEFQSAYDSGEYENNKIAVLATAVLEELGGNLSADGLGNLGIDLQAHHAIYATGVFPVMRVSLKDAGKLRAAIGRIEAKIGFEIPVETLNGTSYWRVSEGDMPVGVYIAILDQQLAISMFPVSAEDKLLAAFLGQEMPEQSMASTNALAIMNSKKGYTGYGSGILDMQKLANEMLNADSATHSYLGEDMHFDIASLDAVCVAETRAVIAKAPRMTAGTTKLSTNEIAFRYELEIENSLAAGLAALVSNTPAAAETDSLFSASLALQVGKLRAFILEKATAIAATPFECNELQQLNQGATELAAQLNIPMPPMVNNLMGVRASMDKFDPTGDFPQGTGLLALHVDKPEMFVGMATMMVPGFEELDLQNQSEPVRIPADMIHMEGLDIFALMGDEAIGASIGEENASNLGAFMNAKSQDDGTFFSISYDIAKQMEIQMAMSEHFGIQQDNDQSAHDEFSDEFSAAVMDSYSAMFDRSRVDARLTSSGLVIDSSITFK
ncbi:MAG: hypothetical protein GQ538_00840 [Xanthomonadales bacterium]|nr:hypothetical protein [Xanthomonadales bacterium]